MYNNDSKNGQVKCAEKRKCKVKKKYTYIVNIF